MRHGKNSFSMRPANDHEHSQILKRTVCSSLEPYDRHTQMTTTVSPCKTLSKESCSYTHNCRTGGIPPLTYACLHARYDGAFLIRSHSTVGIPTEHSHYSMSDFTTSQLHLTCALSQACTILPYTSCQARLALKAFKASTTWVALVITSPRKQPVHLAHLKEAPSFRCL